MRQRKPVLLTILLLTFCSGVVVFSAADKTTAPPLASQLSHIRAVRLSFVQGTVTLRRPGSSNWTAVIVNTPLQEGFALATTKRSFAEVQFENGSTLRLGEMSAVDFTQLALTQQGGHLNRMVLEDGYATLSVVPARRDEYALTAADVTLTPQGKAEFRADLSTSKLQVEVSDGHVLAADAAESQKLSKNRVLTADVSAGSASPFQVADKFQKDEWDKWTEARDRQSTLAYDNSAVDMTGAPTSGWDDLVAYGDWADFPGVGFGWAPYEPLGWSPYSLGMWGSYPGWGYTWISGEPWGWLPFHYGFWDYNPAYGWIWLPGGSDIWSAALVDWYEGPGWIGWAPVGGAYVGAAPGCTIGAAGCVTAIPRNRFGTGAPLRSGSPGTVNVSSAVGARPISASVLPAALASAPIVAALVGSSISPAIAAGGNGSSSFVRGPEGAPSSVVMGRLVRADSFLAGAFRDTSQPIHVAGGPLLGGRFARNGAKGAGAGSGAGAPQVAAGGPRIAAPQIATAASRGSFGGSVMGRAVGGQAGGDFRGGGFSGGGGGGGGAAHSGGGGGGGGGGHR